MKNQIAILIKKYENYISNLEFDTVVNSRKGYAKEINDTRVKDLREVLYDLIDLDKKEI